MTDNFTETEISGDVRLSYCGRKLSIIGTNGLRKLKATVLLKHVTCERCRALYQEHYGEIMGAT